MYDYRKLTPEQQERALRYRKLKGNPLHDLPHLCDLNGWFLISASTYEHKHHFRDDDDLAWLARELQDELEEAGIPCAAWVVLPNHYHVLVYCHPLSIVSEPLRRVHARTALGLNRRSGLIGRQVWYRYSDRRMRNERHYWTTVNYIHYNPVKHSHAPSPLS